MRGRILIFMLSLLFIVPLLSGCLTEERIEPIGDVPSNGNLVKIIEAVDPDLSHDGRNMVYIDNVDNDLLSEIWVMNLETKEKTMVLESNDEYDLWSETYPTFSPDGTKIVFNAWTGIYVISRLGPEWAENCIPQNIALQGPFPLARYSPDGTKITCCSNKAIESVPSGHGNIWIMDADGSNQTPLTTHPNDEDQPAFTPDGKDVIYIRGGQIWSVNIKTKEQQRITTGEASRHAYSMPTFTPDGRILVVSSRDSPHYSGGVGGNSVWIMDADGTNQTMIYSASTKNQHAVSASISGDGTKIVIQLWWALFLLEDPDGDGIWEDSDGDGVADVCDDYPDNPDRGYLKDPPTEDTIPTFNIGLVLIVVVLLAFAVGYGRRTKR